MLPMQIGICGFKHENNTLSCYPFNFYIFPFEHSAYARVFYSNVGSLSFLSHNNFDFNKWVYEGVGFIAKDQYESYQNALDKQKERQEEIERTVDPSSNDTVIYCNSKFLEIRDWIKQCELEKNFDKVLKIDLSMTPFKYFHGLQKNLPK